jgi:hypothetical protein
MMLLNPKPALKPGYSKVLIGKIMLAEEHPAIAITSLDMMILAHFAVRERTKVEWKIVLDEAELDFVGVYH